jgi:putative nucleotidyltransferase with HDIG domain
MIFLGFVVSCAGAVSTRHTRTRLQTFRGAVAIFLGTTAVSSLFLIMNSAPLETYATITLIAAINGMLTVILINLFLPITEYCFGITTNISLLELSDLNHPLLKRLQLEAPGSYHHTLMVATLAEHAAEGIGANTLLTRVATYFHDIGKLSNPSYFTENSFGEDRHVDLSPRMSSLIILNHVKEGLVLAAKFKLKKPIRDVIATHHGTSLIYFFFRRAKDELSKGEKEMKRGNLPVDIEEDYRYPGPLPKTREETIISLADSCEAASRSLEKPTPQKIDTLVNDIFQNRLFDGQLDESVCTMQEIYTIKESIKVTLRSMLHIRTAYPKEGEVDPLAVENDDSDDTPNENEHKDSNEDSAEQKDEKASPEEPIPSDEGAENGSSGKSADD